MSSPLHLSIRDPDSRRRAFLRRHILAAHARLSPGLRELSVAVVDGRTMSDLHRRFLNRRGPTDVMAFELDADARGRVTAGEVVVCIDVARVASRRRGIALRHELLLYALHGMLHLCGYDDRNAADSRRMHAMEDALLSELGIGPVFAGRNVPRRRRSRGNPGGGPT